MARRGMVAGMRADGADPRMATIAGTQYEIRLDGRAWDPWDCVRQVRAKPPGEDVNVGEAGCRSASLTRRACGGGCRE